MNANEKIFVKSFDCQSVQDDWKNGESLEIDSAWTSRDVGFDNGNGFDSIEDALKAICKSLHFDYKKENWCNYGLDFDYEIGRFDFDCTVNKDNCQDTDWELKQWKDGERTLWNCHVYAYLEVRSTRKLTLNEIKEFNM